MLTGRFFALLAVLPRENKADGISGKQNGPPATFLTGSNSAPVFRTPFEWLRPRLTSMGFQYLISEFWAWRLVAVRAPPKAPNFEAPLTRRGGERRWPPNEPGRLAGASSRFHFVRNDKVAAYRRRALIGGCCHK